MARQDKKAYELSDAEQRDLVTLIQQGKPLPEKYRSILFEDKREVELVWNGKTRDVCTTVLPFQTLGHTDEPRAQTKTQKDICLASNRCKANLPSLKTVGPAAISSRTNGRAFAPKRIEASN